MGGLQGWHLVILFLIAVVVVVVVVVMAVARPKRNPGVGPDAWHVRVPGQGQQQVQEGQPQAQGGYPQPMQVGYAMDGRPIYQQTGTNTFAILALVLGLFTGVLGIVFGHIARGQIRRTGEAGDGLAIAGLVIGYLWLAFWVLLIGASAGSRF